MASVHTQEWNEWCYNDGQPAHPRPRPRPLLGVHGDAYRHAHTHMHAGVSNVAVAHLAQPSASSISVHTHTSASSRTLELTQPAVDIPPAALHTMKEMAAFAVASTTFPPFLNWAENAKSVAQHHRGNPSFATIPLTMRQIVQRHGLSRLLVTGMGTSVAREVCYNTSRWMLYTHFRKKDMSFQQRFSAAFCSGLLGSFVANPFDLLRVRQQSAVSRADASPALSFTHPEYLSPWSSRGNALLCSTKHRPCPYVPVFLPPLRRMCANRSLPGRCACVIHLTVRVSTHLGHGAAELWVPGTASSS